MKKRTAYTIDPRSPVSRMAAFAKLSPVKYGPEVSDADLVAEEARLSQELRQLGKTTEDVTTSPLYAQRAAVMREQRCRRLRHDKALRASARAKLDTGGMLTAEERRVVRL